VITAAFSSERRSEGSPSVCHDACFATSERRRSGSSSSEHGICRPRRSGTHVSIHILLRNSELNGPMYAMNGAATIMLPTSRSRSSASVSTLSAQRTPSSLRPLTRRSARESRFAVASALAISVFFSSVACISWFCSASLRALSAATVSLTEASFLFASASLPSASCSSARLGATSR
jgi:hypothetical protein